MWGAAKVVHTNRRILAALLGWDESRIRFVELDVGGGFGGRGEFYPEDFLIPFCAIRLGRPVAWTEDRAESLQALNHSREQVHQIAVALSSEGRLLALRDSFVLNTGAYVRTHGSVVPSLTAALLPGPYRWSAFQVTVRQVLTNKTPAGTYRAPGRYEANFARERMIDIAAHRLGLDPVQLRRRNVIRSGDMPYARGTEADGHPLTFDSGDYERLIDRAVTHFDHAAMKRWRREPASRQRCRGLGAAMFVEKSGIARWEYARVALSDRGRARAFVGSASVGQGVETVLAQICADALTVPFDAVDVVHGDTDRVPIGMDRSAAAPRASAGLRSCGPPRHCASASCAKPPRSSRQPSEICGSMATASSWPGRRRVGSLWPSSWAAQETGSRRRRCSSPRT